jgi:hypothetical protein
MVVGRIGDSAAGISGDPVVGDCGDAVVGGCGAPAGGDCGGGAAGGDCGDPVNCSADARRTVVQSRSTSYNKVPYTLLHPL